MKEREIHLKHGNDRLGWEGKRGTKIEKEKKTSKVEMIGRSAQKYLEWLSGEASLVPKE